MTATWQDIFALAIVFAAATYLGRLAWQRLASKKPGCGRCGTCPANGEQTPEKLVSIEPLKRDR